MISANQNVSPKSGLTAFILCLFFGAFGIHRFYVRKIGTGILMILTFGGLGFWMLYDLFSIVCRNFTDSQGQVVEITPNRTAPRKIVITLVFIYIILFGSISALVGVSVRDLANVGKNELVALRQGNIDQAYSYTSSEFQKGVDIATFKKFVDSYPQFHDNVDSTFNDVEYKNNNGSISGTLKMKDGSTVPLEMGLVKENDKWKINEINLKNVVSQAAPAVSAPASVDTTTPPPAKSSEQAPANTSTPAVKATDDTAAKPVTETKDQAPADATTAPATNDDTTKPAADTADQAPGDSDTTPAKSNDGDSEKPAE